MPYTFRQAGLGKLVGKRTWGGLVGVGGFPQLLDGSSVTAPNWGIWFPKGKSDQGSWDVENVGVAPDVEVELDPKLWRQGRDPQLEKAIEIVKEELKRNPLKWPKRPAYPNYHQKKESARR
jgi:tricorn protease